MNIKKIKEVVVKRLEKHKNNLSMAVKDTCRLLDEIDIKLRLEESNEGKISYKDFNFICNCDLYHVGFLDVGNGAIFCNQCGRIVFVEACCEHCQNVYDPKVDPCKYHICRECLPLVMKEKELDYEDWKKKYLDITGEEWKKS